MKSDIRDNVLITFRLHCQLEFYYIINEPTTSYAAAARVVSRARGIISHSIMLAFPRKYLRRVRAADLRTVKQPLNAIIVLKKTKKNRRATNTYRKNQKHKQSRIPNNTIIILYYYVSRTRSAFFGFTFGGLFTSVNINNLI